MADPVTVLVGAINLSVQAVDTSNQQIIFNRIITGLQCNPIADAGITTYFNIGEDEKVLEPTAYPLMGCMVRNMHETAKVTVMWFNEEDVQIEPIILQAGGIILQFQPTGHGVIHSVSVLSDTPNTPIEFVWWATVPTP